MRACTLILPVLLLASAGQVAAAPAFACARNLYMADLDAAMVVTKETVEAFRTAVADMNIERTASSATNVGSAMMASAMANEVAATAAGLRQIVSLRNQLTAGAGRDIALQQLEQAMADAAERVTLVSETYTKVEAMTTDQRTKTLAGMAAVFTRDLAQKWTCP